jgi:acetyl-CoA/propionyl-CoA carboxylase biotin carboxyl carrier protein
MTRGSGTVFGTVLVANRGEIAVRVMRTLRRLGIRAAAVHSDADAGARHVREADVAVRIGPAESGARNSEADVAARIGTPHSRDAARSYLDVAAILAAARAVGADAVHPGYGFLAENADFAQACRDAGLVFVGPPPAAIRAMGDKISAKDLVAAAGVPVVPGAHRRGMTDADLAAAAREVGFPVLLKPSAGGGGKGMRRVEAAGELADAVAGARREAVAAFGDGELLLERYVERPRHVEIQVLADAHGGCVHLGERECSLQRRHQKVVEEAPSPLLTPAQREAMGAAAVRAALACGYEGAGTVEFVVPAAEPGEHFFLEMNTRLQVEHPVTELVTGLDLVEEQLRVAAGEPLRIAQDAVVLRGHAVEARVYAEDPARDFLPTGGRVLLAVEPAGDGVRVDSGIATGDVVGDGYDPMLAKVVAWGEDRAAALRRLDAALAGTAVLGVTTNVAFLRSLLADPDVAAGRLDTGLVGRRLDALVPRGVPDDVLAVAALARQAARRRPGATDPFDTLTGWRLGGTAWTRELLQVPGHDPVPVAVREGEVRVGEGPVRTGSVAGFPPTDPQSAIDGATLAVTLDGTVRRWHGAPDGEDLWLGLDGTAWRVRAAVPHPRGDTAAAAGSGLLTSPMPGTVIAVHVKPGDVVAAGQPVVVVEAMKMEHVVRATAPGVVAEVPVEVGARVALDEPLVTLEPTGEAR